MTDAMSPLLEAHPPPRLRRRPDARAMTVADLMGKAQRGELRIPQFQRRFRWENDDRVRLLDSIDRGYPIGTILLAKRKASEGVGPLGEGAQAPTLEAALWIIDGQQRLTTLFQALLVEARDDEPRLAFDRQRQTFTLERPRASRQRDLVPAHVLLDAADLGEWVSGQSLPKDEARVVFEMGVRVREYHILTYVVEDDDDDVLRVVFDRINSTGKSLTREEVFQALVGSRIASGPAGLLGVVEHLKRAGFGSLEERTILNSFEAVNDLPIGSRQGTKLSPELAGEGLDRTLRALERAARFFRQEAEIPHAELLPYQLPMVVLAKFFDRYEDPPPRLRVLLRRWVWRGSLARTLTGASGTLAEHVRLVGGIDPNTDVESLLSRTGRPNPQPNVNDQHFSFNSAVSRLEACALLELRPRDLATGEVLDVARLFEDGAALAMRTIVIQQRVDGNPLAASVVNRIAHPPVAGYGSAALILSCGDRALLASHAIEDGARTKLERRDPLGFLEERNRVLRPQVERFFARLAEWNADDSPPLAALRVVEKP